MIEFIPDEIKKRLYERAVEVCSRLAKKILGDEASEQVKKLSIDAEFYNQFNLAMQTAQRRFINEYESKDEDLVAAIKQSDNFWQAKSVIESLQIMIKTPGSYLVEEYETVNQHFNDVFPERVNRERVDRAVVFMLRCLAEELWHLPALLPIYQLHVSRVTSEQLTNMVGELRGLREDNRQTMVALIQTMGQQQLLLTTSDVPLLLTAETKHKTRHNLPTPTHGEFIGRKDEFAQAVALLKPYPHSQYATITVDGIGGVGKTVLALMLGWHYVSSENLDEKEQFDAVVWTCAKRSILTASGIVPREQSLRNLGDIYAELARTLERPDVISARQEEQDSLVRSILSQNRVLLIVDNLETVEDVQVTKFLRELPAPTKTIITTRQRVDGAFPIRLEGLRGVDPLILIDQECQKEGKQVKLTKAERDNLASSTSGVPLAIVWTIGQIRQGHSVETALLRLKSAGHDYARFCFSESVELLQSQRKWYALRLLMGLSLFEDGATRDALGFVSGLEDSKDTRDEGLAELTDLSLINFDNGRYSMLPLAREYAMAELSRDLQFREAAISRWFQWHVRLTKQASGGKTDLDASVLESLGTEHTNILWAIESSFRHERFDIYVQLLRGMEFFWLGTGHWREYEYYLNRGRTLAPDVIDRIHFAARLAWLNVLREDFKEAKKQLAYANNLLQEYPNEYEKMRVEDFTGQLYMEMNELDKAELHLRTSLGLARKMQDRRGQFACLKYLGEVCCKKGDAETAKLILREAEPFAAGTGEDQWIRGLAHVAQLRGLISNTEEKWHEAVTNFQTCIDYLTIWPDERLLTRAMVGLAVAQEKLGHIDEANRLLQENKETFRKLGMQKKVANIEDMLVQKEKLSST